jgi:hypothetical protein
MDVTARPEFARDLSNAQGYKGRLACAESVTAVTNDSNAWGQP